jgi:hypothetical protein
MTDRETYALTQSMLHSGEVLSLHEISGFKVDKHSTGLAGGGPAPPPIDSRMRRRLKRAEASEEEIVRDSITESRSKWMAPFVVADTKVLVLVDDLHEAQVGAP